MGDEFVELGEGEFRLLPLDERDIGFHGQCTLPCCRRPSTGPARPGASRLVAFVET
jgi:hypothetical protein